MKFQDKLILNSISKKVSQVILDNFDDTAFSEDLPMLYDSIYYVLAVCFAGILTSHTSNLKLTHYEIKEIFMKKVDTAIMESRAIQESGDSF